MLGFILRRVLKAIPMLVMISVVCFAIIQLPPGDYVTNYATQLQMAGTEAAQETLDALRAQYGLGLPVHVQYWKWVSGFPSGDFGISMAYGNLPVLEVIGERFILTVAMSLTTLVISWGIAIPIGVYSATHKYGAADYVLTFLGLVGIAVPGFLIALTLLFISVFYFDAQTVGGLFSPQYADAPWSWSKFVDLLRHLPIPLAVIGLGGTAGTMRAMRANLLDILDMQYVQTARAKGLKERVVIWKHAVRIAINPLVSRLGMLLPSLFAGTVIVSIVMDLPTIGPMFLRSLISQDMYLAGTILLFSAALLIVGNMVADVALALIDPRIQHTG
jgi:peptide/nickel transport system permease protein